MIDESLLIYYFYFYNLAIQGMGHEDFARIGKCGEECTEPDRNCVFRVSNGDTWELKRRFWDIPSKPAPLPKERKKRIVGLWDILQALHVAVPVR
jgi:hypothetical protein